MRKFLSAFLIWLALAAPAYAGVGSITDLGNNSVNSSATTLAITTTANISTGDLVIVLGGGSAGSGSAMTAVVDSGGSNVYTFSAISTTTPTLAIAWTWNAVSVASGGTITGTFGSSSARKTITAFRVAGMNTTSLVRDPTINPASVTGTATSATAITSGTLLTQQELLVGFLTFSAAGDPGFNALSGWTAISGATTTAWSKVYYKIVSVTTTDSTYAPTWTASTQYRSALRSFIAGDAVMPVGSTSMVTGVGQ